MAGRWADKDAAFPCASAAVLPDLRLVPLLGGACSCEALVAALSAHGVEDCTVAEVRETRPGKRPGKRPPSFSRVVCGSVCARVCACLCVCVRVWVCVWMHVCMCAEEAGQRRHACGGVCRQAAATSLGRYSTWTVGPATSPVSARPPPNGRHCSPVGISLFRFRLHLLRVRGERRAERERGEM